MHISGTFAGPDNVASRLIPLPIHVSLPSQTSCSGHSSRTHNQPSRNMPPRKPPITLHERECTATLENCRLYVQELHLSNHRALVPLPPACCRRYSTNDRNCLPGVSTTSDALNMAHYSSGSGYYVQFLFTIFLIRSRFAQFETADVYELFAPYERELVRPPESIKVRQLCSLTSGRSCIP